ncbi:MAG: hypothetical protein ABW221_01510 [Vicinamibacteria bacterium]
MKSWIWTSLAAAVLLAAAPARAIDVWDQATEDDNSSGTDNGLIHGAEQLHDLGAVAATADQDWYTLDSQARSSYEVVIDGTTGDMNLAGSDVQRIDDDGTTVLQDSTSLAGYSRVLRWTNNSSTAEENFIRVQGASCGTICSANDQYRIRMYETTYSIPRFNNTGGQITVLNVASMVPFSCAASFHFYNNAGTFLGTQTNNFTARELFVFNTSTAGFAAGTSGSIIVAHNCGYGGLAGKAVALEPATGFTFDTALIPRII